MIIDKRHSWLATRSVYKSRRKQRCKGWWRLVMWAAIPCSISLIAAFIGMIQLLDTMSMGAIYKQSGVDFPRADYSGDYWFAGCSFAFAASLMFFALIRFSRLSKIAHHGRVTESVVLEPVTPKSAIKPWRIRVNTGGTDIEWQLMRLPGKFWWKWLTVHKGALEKPVKIRGELKSGDWLIVQTQDNHLLWPATRSQLVIGTTAYSIPLPAEAEDETVVSHSRLLATYVQVLNQLNALPFVIRCPSDRATWSWWWLGAPRFLVVWLVSQRIRRSMNTMSNALCHTALLTGVSGGRNLRHTLREASKECQELVDTLPRPGPLTFLVPIVTIVLPVYATFFATPHISVNAKALLGLYFLWLIIGFAPLMVLYRSAQCTQVIFGSRVFNYEIKAKQAQYPNGWAAYEAEKDAFGRVNMIMPRELGGQPRLFWLFSGIYGLSIIITILIIGGPAHSGLLFMVVFATVVCQRILAEGGRGFISRLRTLHGQVNRSLR
jgi:hypothetical protein